MLKLMPVSVCQEKVFIIINVFPGENWLFWLWLGLTYLRNGIPMQEMKYFSKPVETSASYISCCGGMLVNTVNRHKNYRIEETFYCDINVLNGILCSHIKCQWNFDRVDKKNTKYGKPILILRKSVLTTSNSIWLLITFRNIESAVWIISDQ